MKKWCVGIALDGEAGKLYWTQKGPDNAGQGRIFRANLEIPKGQTPANRKDIEVLYQNLPEPIDLELDLANRTIYWTDRGDPPRGNTVNRASMDPSQGNGTKEPAIIFDHLMEGIGMALDLKGGRMFMTDLGGSVYSANLDGSNRKTVLALRRKPDRHSVRGSSCRFVGLFLINSISWKEKNNGLASLCFAT